VYASEPGLDVEFEFGVASLADALAGAERFRAGHGRHGDFSDI
jgi:enoyl-CoA hydratase